jgi:Flp pilus assembly protein TadB
LVLDATRDRPTSVTTSPITVSAVATLSTVLMAVVAVTDGRRPATIRRRLDHLRPDGPNDQGAPRNLRPLRLLRTRVGLAVGVSVAALAMLGPAAALVGLTSCEAARRASAVHAHRRTRSRIECAVPDAVELFVLLVHAGLTPVQAVHRLSSIAPDATRTGFAGVTHRQERGDTFADALGALPDRLGPSVVGLADLVAAADRYGSPLEPMLESLAAEARSARRRLSEADARRLPIRLSFPLVVCTLPSFVFLAIAPAVIAALSSITVPI